MSMLVEDTGYKSDVEDTGYISGENEKTYVSSTILVIAAKATVACRAMAAVLSTITTEWQSLTTTTTSTTDNDNKQTA